MKNLNFPVLITHFYFLSLINNHIAGVFASAPTFIPVDNIALVCGSSANITTPDGREWIGDEQYYSKFAHILEQTNSTTSPYGVPYTTARIFCSPFTYSFSITPGPKFVRLYFYPAMYLKFDFSHAYFKVTAGSFTLLNNFNPSRVVAESSDLDCFMREFCVNVVLPNQRLNLTFIPSHNYSCAFVNGIEIVSMPENLYYGVEEGMNPPTFVGQDHPSEIVDSLALEMIWRLNMGESTILSTKDTGMYREWSSGNNLFLLTEAFKFRNVSKPLIYSRIRNYTAPDDLYRTAISMGNNKTENSLHNLTWRLPVVQGFNYLVRLHFCEFRQENGSRFSIYLGNQMAEPTFDVLQYSGGTGIPTYRDYVVKIYNEDVLSIDLDPDEKHYAILNGVEVFKISNNRDLAVPEFQAETEPTTDKSKKKKTTLFIALAAMGFLVIIVCIVSWVYHIRKTKYYTGKSTKASSLPEELCRRFSLSEMKMATNNFDQELVIGRGGFGNVYRGFINGGSKVVAVKRLNQGSNQGAREFVTEIQMLSQLRYVHLVSLIGYCDDKGEMILVYEYMANGTFRDHLYGSNNDPLTWKQRLEICLGAARGLHYLHTGMKDTVIHRDVKTTNILLDEKWVAKVSDFGLSKVGPSDTAVSTLVKGTFGYLDPEYARSQHLTDKSDVYSFGVVLFEMLCARKPLDKNLDMAQWNLAHWARKCIMEETVYNIIDPFLMGKIAPECFKKFVKVAESCVRDQRIQRPKMCDVMEKLEFILQLQEQADAAKEGINPDGVYSYPEVSFRASDIHVSGYDKSGLHSGTDLSTGLSFLSEETESDTHDKFSSETTAFESSEKSDKKS